MSASDLKFVIFRDLKDGYRWRLSSLQNTQKGSEQGLQHKLDAVADGLADLMEHFAVEDPERRAAKEDLAGDIEDLRAAVGLEGEM